MRILKETNRKEAEFKKASQLIRVLELRNKLDDALLKGDKYEIEHIYADFKALEKEFKQNG